MNMVGCVVFYKVVINVGWGFFFNNHEVGFYNKIWVHTNYQYIVFKT